MEKQILMVEDDEATTFLQKRIIQMVAPAAEVHSFHAAAPALEFLQKSWDISGRKSAAFGFTILLDLNLPGLDGWGILEELESWPAEARNNLKIYVLTASINPDDRERSTQHSSIQGFITKPLTRKQVSEMLN